MSQPIPYTRRKPLTPEQKERARVRRNEWYAANKDKQRTRQREWERAKAAADKAARPRKTEGELQEHAANVKERRRARTKAWVQENRQRVRESSRRRTKERREAGVKRVYKKVVRSRDEKDKAIARMAAWAKRNPERARALWNASSANRRALKISATPLWANKFFMREAFDLARRRSQATGFVWHVDHIVPLVSKRVCGLHCEANLQVIPGRENQMTFNSVWPDMP